MNFAILIWLYSLVVVPTVSVLQDGIFISLQLKDLTAMANPRAKLELDPGSLAVIIDTAVVASTEIVNFYFNALAASDLSKAPDASQVMYRFSAPTLSAEQRRSMHEAWILAKAFQELLRAVRHSLEDAHVIVSLVAKTHSVKSIITLSEFLRPFQSKAASLKFPDLLAAVNDQLNPKLDFATAYQSLQSARNCLEHRNGIVSKIETHGEDSFKLSVPRIKLFYMRDSAEIEIAVGHKIEPGDDRDGVDVLMKLDVQERSFVLGERIAFTLKEFNEIAFACHFLGQQLSSKLPRPKLTEEKA